MNFKKIKANYDKGILPIKAIRVLVLLRILTKNQYKEITGQDY